jgi:hypothetical protein
MAWQSEQGPVTLACAVMDTVTTRKENVMMMIDNLFTTDSYGFKFTL